MKPDALTNAMQWGATVLTGSIATGVAILGVAAIGLLMLGGRIATRRGIGVVLGCFIVFSAGTIADGLISGTGTAPPDVAALQPAPVAYSPTAPKPVPYDPYAGASVPVAGNDGLIR